MDLVEASIANDNRKTKRRNNAFRLKASQRCGQFIEKMIRSESRRRKGKAGSPLIKLRDKIFQAIDDEPRKVIYGDHLFNDIVYTINNYTMSDGTPYKLRLDQQKMVAFILTSCLPMIYKHDLEVHKARILRILKTTKIHELLLILASRRVGKTTCIATVAAALMICKPEIALTIFANVKKSSKRVMVAIVHFLNMDPRGRNLLAAKDKIANQEDLELTDPVYGTKKRLETYAATTNVCSPFLSFSFFFVVLLMKRYVRLLHLHLFSCDILVTRYVNQWQQSPLSPALTRSS